MLRDRFFFFDCNLNHESEIQKDILQCVVPSVDGSIVCLSEHLSEKSFLNLILMDCCGYSTFLLIYIVYLGKF